METVYVALGSNLDNPLAQLEQAVTSLKTFAKNLQCSAFYGSKPLGPQDQPDYVNAVVKFDTALTPLALLDKLQQIENEQGRVRLRRWGERTLDLDILLYGNQQIESVRLTIPHYDMHNREFVIVPLYEINPALLLPNGTPLRTLYAQFREHKMLTFSNPINSKMPCVK